jgi:hypothetical protein
MLFHLACSVLKRKAIMAAPAARCHALRYPNLGEISIPCLKKRCITDTLFTRNISE